MNAKEVCYNTRITVRVGGVEVYHYEVKNATVPTDMRGLLNSIVAKYGHKPDELVLVRAKLERVTYISYDCTTRDHKSYYHSDETVWGFIFSTSGYAIAEKEKIDYFSAWEYVHRKDGTYYSHNGHHYKTTTVYNKKWKLR
jgi:hypothetical protein